MKRQLFSAGTLLLLSFTLLLSCKNKDKTDVDRDANTTLDNANSQSAFDDALKSTESVLSANSAAKVSLKVAAGGSTTGTCAQSVDITDYGNNHKSFIITFSGICSDSKTRTGKLLVDLSGGASYNTVGAVTTITSDGYTVNGILVRGKKTVTCMSSGIHNIVVSDVAGTGYATIKYLNGDSASWKSTRTRTLFSGGATVDISDNVYDISTTSGQTNAAEGINKEGRHYLVNINSPIRIDFNCFANNTARYPTQGILALIPDGITARSVDYGTGACDNDVTVTVGKFSFPVTLSY